MRPVSDNQQAESGSQLSSARKAPGAEREDGTVRTAVMLLTFDGRYCDQQCLLFG